MQADPGMPPPHSVGPSPNRCPPPPSGVYLKLAPRPVWLKLARGPNDIEGGGGGVPERCVIGRTNAAVFPDPVTARQQRSIPWRAGRMTCAGGRPRMLAGVFGTGFLLKPGSRVEEICTKFFKKGTKSGRINFDHVKVWVFLK